VAVLLSCDSSSTTVAGIGMMMMGKIHQHQLESIQLNKKNGEPCLNCETTRTSSSHSQFIAVVVVYVMNDGQHTCHTAPGVYLPTLRTALRQFLKYSHPYSVGLVTCIRGYIKAARTVYCMSSPAAAAVAKD